MEATLDLLLKPLTYEFMQRALLASVVVGIICSVLSCYLIVKRWALLGDAISHAVLPGVGIAYIIGIQFFWGAVVTGVLTALGIGFIERNTRIKQDAAIGIMFTSAFALGILIISLIRTKTVDIYHILFGNVLGVATPDLILTVIAGIAVMLTVLLLFKELELWSFDQVMAQAIGLPVRFFHYLLMFILSLTIVASLQTVGIVLVIAMLITPGATAYLIANSLKRMMAVASVFGILSAITGLFASYYLNVASGPAMVLMSAIFFGLAMFLSPQRGLVWQWRRRRIASLNALIEDYLKHIYHSTEEERQPPSVMGIAERLGTSVKNAKRVIERLRKSGLVEYEGEGIVLTQKGRDIALRVIRSHRLWELYLAKEAGLDWAEVHEQAERFEHLADRASEQIDEILGKPDADPHGHPIPSSEGIVVEAKGLSLLDMKLGHTAIIRWVKDEDPNTLRYLATIGLFPKTRVTVKGKNTETGYLIVNVNNYDYAINPEIARSVYVDDLGLS
jgi:ABC-type Mn2+/Zn2+ transport system permease subunit/Mn-dependent DtxR family transcriptional regulator